MNYAIRVSSPFVDCSGILLQWCERATSAFIFEHEADAEVNRTHCHLGLYGCLVKAEALKRMWKGAPGSGNGFWSFKPCDPWTGAAVDTKYLTYCSKGVLAPKYVKNISEHLVEEAKGRWVTKSPDPKPASRQGDKKKKQDDLYEIVEIIKSRYDQQTFKPTPSQYDDIERPTTFQLVSDLTNIAIDVLKEKRKRYNIYDFPRYITPIIAEEEKSSFTNVVFERIFPPSRV